MRRPLKWSRKEEEKEEEALESASEIDCDNNDIDSDMLSNMRNESDDDYDYNKDDDDVDSDEDGESGGDGTDEEGDDEEGEDDDDDDNDNVEEKKEDSDKEGQLNEEMKQLEKEYMELQYQEQNLLRNLKRHKDDDVLKGQAVKNQKALWDKILEFKFLLQKAFSSSNRLPQEQIRSLFCGSGDEVINAYSDLINSSKKTLDSMLELQEVLFERNPAIAQCADVNTVKHLKHIETSGNVDGEDDEEWSKISQMQSRMTSFRDKSVDKWHRKTQVTTGAVAIKGKLQAFNQSISEQVAAYMRDPSKMIMGMQQNRSAVALFGTAPDSPDKMQEVVNAYGEPELLDDSEFYQQLLKEFFETIDSTSSEAVFYALKRLQTKKRKIVDRRASKSRKIRYNVHEKIVNFMAPRPVELPDMAPKLFQNLFGLRSQNRPQEA